MTTAETAKQSKPTHCPHCNGYGEYLVEAGEYAPSATVQCGHCTGVRTRKTYDELEAELLSTREKLEQAEQDREIAQKLVHDGFKLEELHIQNGSMDMKMRHETLVKLFASAWAEWFKENGGSNFVSVEADSEEIGPFEIVMRRRLGKSPEVIAAECRERAEQAEAKTAKLEHELERMADVLSIMSAGVEVRSAVQVAEHVQEQSR